MRGILFEYELNPTTWVYLSSLLIIGIYFKFHRFWSLRNLDLIALISFSPGLLLLYHGMQRQLAGELLFGRYLERFGYIWLFSVGGFFLIRLLLDSTVVRRPLLEPNLSAGGLTFTGVALLVFLMSNVINPKPGPHSEDSKQVPRLEHVVAAQQPPVRQGPGYAPFLSFAGYVDPAARDLQAPDPQALDLQATNAEQVDRAESRPDPMRGAVAILGHLAVVIGMVLVGYRHFDNIQTGVAAAALYLLLPYTAQMTARVDHVIPAALMVWAVLAYRRPVISGVLIGLAAGLIYYPLFLLPLWCGFYWRRGLVRFGAAVAVTLIVLVVLLALGPAEPDPFGTRLQQMFGWINPLGPNLNLAGFWQFYEPVFRIPVLAAFVVMSIGLGLWPAQKNLGTLLSCSAAVMLAGQFWQAQHGGMYVAWYVPLLLLTVFRPNLEDRVAITTLTEGRLRWLSGRPARIVKAA